MRASSRNLILYPPHWKLDNPYYHNSRKREVALARISLYIVLVFLLCHIIRIIPNAYEMIQSYNLGVSMTFKDILGSSLWMPHLKLNLQ